MVHSVFAIGRKQYSIHPRHDKRGWTVTQKICTVVGWEWEGNGRAAHGLRNAAFGLRLTGLIPDRRRLFEGFPFLLHRVEFLF